MEEFLNNLSPSAFDFYVEEMMFDATAPIQFKNDNFNSEVIGLSFSIRHYLWVFFFFNKKKIDCYNWGREDLNIECLCWK